MKVFVVLPAAKGTYPPEAEQRRIDVVRSYSTAEVQVDVGFPAEASGFMPYGGSGPGGVQVARNHILVAERMIQAEQEGYDACFPFGMIDFGVEIARGMCSIPIVGQTQAAYCMAAMMAQRMGIISYQSSGHSHFWRQLREYGFEHMCVGMGAAEMPNNEMPSRRQELYDRFVSEGKRLVKEEGAEVIVCHGMSMSPIEFKAEEYAEGIGVPVLEGVGCALAMAVAWVRIGTPYSPIRTGAGARLPGRPVQGIRKEGCMRVLVVLPGAQGVYPREDGAAPDRRRQVVLNTGGGGRGGLPRGACVRADGPRRDGDRGGAQPYSVGERMIKAEKEGYDAAFPFGIGGFWG